MTKRVPITVWLTPTELATIDRIAAEQNRPRSAQAVHMLNQALRFGIAYQTPQRQAEMAMYDLTTPRLAGYTDGPWGPYPFPYPGDQNAEHLDEGGWAYTYGGKANLPRYDRPSDSARWCRAMLGNRGYTCTELAGDHPWHIAATDSFVIAVWWNDLRTDLEREADQQAATARAAMAAEETP